MKRILAVLVAAMLWAGVGEGAVYYIDPAGNDNNAGTASDNAWATVTKVNEATFAAGDSVLFKKGKAWRGNLNPPSDGTTESSITFGSYGTGSNPIISGTHTITNDYITIQGIKFKGSISWTGTGGSASGLSPIGKTRVHLWDGNGTEEAILDSTSNTFAAGTRVYGETQEYDNIIGHWDYFINNTFSGWSVEKATLGNDQSDARAIYSYTFTPKSGRYDRTILLVAGVHGQEQDSVMASHRFFYYLVSNNLPADVLSAIENVRYVICPFANPYGAGVLGVRARTSGNSNSVDINRNFSWNWDAQPDETKGASAESEAETIILKGLITTYSPAFVLDMHNHGASDFHFYNYLPHSTLYTESEPVIRVVEHLGYSAVDYLPSDLDKSTLHNYAASINIGSYNFEYGPWNSGENGVQYSSEYITEAVKQYGNMILSVSQTEPR